VVDIACYRDLSVFVCFVFLVFIGFFYGGYLVPDFLATLKLKLLLMLLLYAVSLNTKMVIHYLNDSRVGWS